MGIEHISNQFRKHYPNCTLAEVRSVTECCRDIRIQMLGAKAGKVYIGHNSITEETENWLCISVAKDWNRTQLQRVFGYVD